MTCIAGISHKGKVYMGADSFALADSIVYSCDTKLFRRGEFLMGVAGDWRYAEILAFALEFQPPSVDADVRRYMATDFTKAIRQAVKEYGFMQSEEGRDRVDSRALVGIRGCLFNFDGLLSHLCIKEGFSAIGSGTHVALGSLYESQDSDADPKTRINRALRAAEALTDGVRAPFYIESL